MHMNQVMGFKQSKLSFEEEGLGLETEEGGRGKFIA